MELIKIKHKKMNKKGLQFKSAFFALTALSLIILSMGNWITQWNGDYNSGLLYDLDDYDKSTELKEISQSQSDNIGVKSSTQGEDFEGTSIRGVFGILNNIENSFLMVFGKDGMLDSVGERFNIPNYVLFALVTFMIFGITFALVRIFFRLPGRSV